MTSVPPPLPQYFNLWLGASDNVATFGCSAVIVLSNVFGVLGSLWSDWRMGVRCAGVGRVCACV